MVTTIWMESHLLLESASIKNYIKEALKNIDCLVIRSKESGGYLWYTSSSPQFPYHVHSCPVYS